MKKVLSLVLALVLVFALAACGGTAASTPAASIGGDAPASTGGDAPAGDDGELAKSACMITEYGLDSPFIALCWQAFEKLESEGWKVQIVETSEATEFADQIRAMAAEGYTSIVMLFDNLSNAAVELSDELAEAYPDLWVFLCDSYADNPTTNMANIICDPWESSFVAGYVAANMTEKEKVGWIGHTNNPTQDRFSLGYEAGVKYANNGVTVEIAYVGDSADSVKGQETAKAMIQNHDVDIIYQAANQSGLGVIEECINAGIKCIGVDMWQGEIDEETVFWSALKPIDEAIYDCCVMAQAGTWEGNMMYYDLAHGAKVYDDRDFDKLPADLQTQVKQLTDDISSGAVDVYEGYDDYRYEG